MYTTQGQLIHSLSFLSNAAFDIKADNFPKLQDDTTAIVTQTLKDAGVQGDIGKWDLLWGPIVFSNDRTSKTVVADNTMMLVYNAEQNLFVVAIAGTNAVSTYGFFQEDFGVNNLIDWNVVVPDADKKSGSIAAGTKQGLDILLGMTGPELMIEGTPTGDMVTALSDYMAYLKKQNASFTATNVAVTGHSLGGALAPVMALYLQDDTSWNKSGVATTISAWPTAGPTPGNKEFADYAGGRMKGNYNSFYNPIDVIPQAWAKESLQNVPTLYKDGIPAPESSAPFYTPIGTLVAGASLDSINVLVDYFAPISYTQIAPWQQLEGAAFFPGAETLLNRYFDLVTSAMSHSGTNDYFDYLKCLLRFLKQMLYQHTKAYNTLLDIDDFMNRFSEIKKRILNTASEDLDEDAFFTAMKKYYGLPDLRAIAANAEATVA